MRCGYIPFFMPARIRRIFTGSATRNPHAMAICIVNQNTNEVRGIASPPLSAKIATFYRLYMPACHAVSESMSALAARRIASQRGSVRSMPRIAAYWNPMPNARARR